MVALDAVYTAFIVPIGVGFRLSDTDLAWGSIVDFVAGAPEGFRILEFGTLGCGTCALDRCLFFPGHVHKFCNLTGLRFQVRSSQALKFKNMRAWQAASPLRVF